MTNKSDSITTDELQAALEEARKDLGGEVLPGRPSPKHFTIQEYAESFDPPLAYATADDQLRRGVRSGAYVVTKAYQLTDDYRKTMVNFYRKVIKEVPPCPTGLPQETHSSTRTSPKSTK